MAPMCISANTTWRLSKIISRYKLQLLRNTRHQAYVIFPPPSLPLSFFQYSRMTSILLILRKELTFGDAKIFFCIRARELSQESFRIRV